MKNKKMDIDTKQILQIPMEGETYFSLRSDESSYKVGNIVSEKACETIIKNCQEDLKIVWVD